MDDLLSFAQVLVLAGCAPDTLRHWCKSGKFPKPTHQKGRCRYWRKDVAEAAVKALVKPLECGK